MSLTNLQNFALNILKKTKHVAIQNVDVPEIVPCSECGEKIIMVNYEPFTILVCGHIFHRKCVEKKFLLTKSNVCPIPGCDKSVEPVVYVVYVQNLSELSEESQSTTSD